jgi:hypothetical protein
VAVAAAASPTVFSSPQDEVNARPKVAIRVRGANRAARMAILPFVVV